MKRHARDHKRLNAMMAAELRALATKLRRERVPPADADDDSMPVLVEALEGIDRRDMLSPGEVEELHRDKKQTAAALREAYKLRK
jgi:hypothetical protein